MGEKLQVATFGAGCFWGVEGTYMHVSGVKRTAVGYMGGTTPNPTYEMVKSQVTGHAEVVQLRFDPKLISYKALLEVFWSCHDPTQKNKQGMDVGTQYRSVIFYSDKAQKRLAEASKRRMNRRRFGNRIATEISPATTFWKAEEYHQKYLQKNRKVRC